MPSDETSKSPTCCAAMFLEDAMARAGAGEQMQHLLRSPTREIRFDIPLRRESGGLEVYRGYRVQHNNSLGPYKGGLRYHPDVDLSHFRDLASTMTWKASLAHLPFGGAKGGIDCDPHALSDGELEVLTKRFVERVAVLVGPTRDIPAPDMGTSPRTMAWIYEEYSKLWGDSPGVVTGKPVVLGGSEGRLEATGTGVARVACWTARRRGQSPADLRVAIQGFGNVATHAALALNDAGARVVAVSNSKGAAFDGDGLDIEHLVDAYADAPDETLAGLAGAETLSGAELLALDVDILIPAAMEGAITEDNAGEIRADLVVEAANLPTSCPADHVLHGRGIPVVPDILANAGGIIVSYFEWVQNRQAYPWPEEEVMDELDATLGDAWRRTLDCAEEEDLSLREAAYKLAVMRVKEAIELRGL